MTLSNNPTKIATTLEINQSSSRDEFARQAAKAEFGPRHYADPRDANFVDRPPPNWRLLGDVASQVLEKAAARMALRDALRSPKLGEAANAD